MMKKQMSTYVLQNINRYKMTQRICEYKKERKEIYNGMIVYRPTMSS